ncbi:NAD-dependent epimerase/dehydratase family protein [Flavobacterium crassostreae]|uniref:NAD-dependent epimerase n=1 Tax=Flavobacterium crassostreae TaxID=1763534 RepID=A0A1B9E697_9FLAO|nr:NAD-dependent epimerase/dehydratase family protein [Flavobacterium crassostreae]OCB77388.1 NAD-dependent epimerase [Flavobacterium crassostreae]
MILVTGGTGLVGAHLLLHLAESTESQPNSIRAIYRKAHTIEKTKALFEYYKKKSLLECIQWVQADITDIPALENAFTDIQQVYHCAAMISFDPKDEAAMRKINIEGTANVVNFSIVNGIKKICYISSTAALGDLAPNETEITETSEWNPENTHSDYAISKYGAEMEIWRGQQEGLKVLIVNPGVILGPGFMDQGSGLLFKRVKNGLSFYTSGTTGFVAVTDVVTKCIALMESPINNQRYILVAENCSFKTILDTLADALQAKRPTIALHAVIMGLLWRLDYLVSFIFRKKRSLTKDTAKASCRKIIFRNTKIKTDLKTDFISIASYIQETKFF